MYAWIFIIYKIKQCARTFNDYFLFQIQLNKPFFTPVPHQ